MVLSRQMSSWKDLVVEPSRQFSLKGLKRTRDARVILVQLLSMKVKAYVQLRWNCLGFDDQGANPLCLAPELLCVVPKPPPGRPFIYIGRRP